MEECSNQPESHLFQLEAKQTGSQNDKTHRDAQRTSSGRVQKSMLTRFPQGKQLAAI